MHDCPRVTDLAIWTGEPQVRPKRDGGLMGLSRDPGRENAVAFQLEWAK